MFWFWTKYCVFVLHPFSNNSRCHWIVCVSALMGKGKQKWEVNGKKSIFTFNCPECLEWFYSLHQIAVCIYKIYFLFKSVYFWGKTLISLWEWGFWDEGPHWPCSSGPTGGTGPEAHRQCARFYFTFSFSFCFYLLIDLLCCPLVWD